MECSIGCAAKPSSNMDIKVTPIAATQGRSFSKSCTPVISMPILLSVLYPSMRIFCNISANHKASYLGSLYRKTSSGCFAAIIGSFTRTGGREGLVFLRSKNTQQLLVNQGGICVVFNLLVDKAHWAFELHLKPGLLILEESGYTQACSSCMAFTCE